MTKTLKIFIALVALLAFVPTTAALAAPKGKVRFSATSYTVREGDPGADAIAHITVTHKGPAAKVNYTTTSGTATPGSDYTPVSGQLTWNSGDNASKTIDIPVTSDLAVEGNETVGLSLRPAKGSVVANPKATLTIIDNDGPARYSFETNAYAASEADGSKTITVFRAGDPSTAADIGYAVTGGTAPASNYSLTAGTLHFAAGDLSKTFNVGLADNGAHDGDRTVVLGLSSATSNLQPPTSSTLTILDDDTPPTIQLDAAQSFSAGEGDGVYMVSITRSGDPNGTVSVDLSTLDGSADSTDYDAVAGDTISIDSGEGTPESGPVTYAIGITDDNVHEPAETFTATLGNPASGAQLGSLASHGVAITDDDPVPTVTLGGTTVTTDADGNTVVTVTAGLSNPSSTPVTVDFSVIDPATGNVIATGTITIPAGQTSGTVTIVRSEERRV